MTEEFIHFLWKFRMLAQDLHTTAGDGITVIHPGEHNSDSGPDFFNARVRIGGTLWAGNVEMHVMASDWDRHGHSDDPAYANTILHVVHTADAEIRRPDGSLIPTLAVDGRFPADVMARYADLMANRQWIPCSNLLGSALFPDFGLWAPSLAVDRLLIKAERIREILTVTGFDWEETLYRWLARGFGFRINAFPFEMLAASLSCRMLNRYRNSPLQVESLLFGQACLLEGTVETEYLQRLRIEYGFLKAKHGLEPIPEGLWKFLRLRPSNFPTIRISQFGDLITRRDPLLPFVLERPCAGELAKWFDVRAGHFWDNHYTFERISPNSEKRLGDSSAALLVINAVVPFLFSYGLEKDEREFREHAIHLLEALPGEDNLEIRRWRETGLDAKNALEAQALLQLKSSFCDRKRCLLCRIGKGLLDRGTLAR